MRFRDFLRETSFSEDEAKNIIVYESKEYMEGLRIKPDFHNTNFYFNTSNGRLPFDFSNDAMPIESGISGYEAAFSCEYNKTLKSLKGAPREVGYLMLKSCGAPALEGAPMIVRDDCWLDYADRIETLQGIGKRYLKEIRGSFGPPDRVKSHILGILIIKGLQHITTSSLSRASDELKAAYDTINEHMKEKDIMDCQEALFDKGLKEYAQL